MTMPAILLPGQAEHLYWIGRYLERALCRSVLILDMQAAFGPVAQIWETLPDAFADGATYRSAQKIPVPDFYAQPGLHGVRGMIAQARDNARIVRPILPEAFWEQMTTLLAIEGTTAEFFAAARQGLLAISGVADRLLKRDESWIFFRLGQLLERAEQTICLCAIEPPGGATLHAAWIRQLPRLLGAGAAISTEIMLKSHDMPASPVFNLVRAEALLRRLPCPDLAEDCRRGSAAIIDDIAAWLAAQQTLLDRLHRGILAHIHIS